MKKIKDLFLSAIIILASLSIVDAIALEKESHKFLNEIIIEQNKESLSAYLNSNLGFSDGIKQILNGREVIVWFREGGRQEDEPSYARSLNHFHDPLQPWYLAGFDRTFKSSLIWAQDQGMIGSLFGGDWSWKKARSSFYKGLTSVTRTEREKNLADTFRALGQMMHLIQDASVPAHVRNDPHVYIDLFGKKIGKYHYETWVHENLSKISLSPINFDKAILSMIPEATAPIPIANIFDTNQYNGTNPGIAVGSRIGMTEYTNANFFSEGTIFKNYPHPAYADTNFFGIDWRNPEVIDAEDGKLDRRIYIKKTVGEQLQRLASLSYISYDCIKKGYYQFSPIVLDSKVYEEYASKLIPRAVGYSAGLLDYFFRGRIEITLPPTGVYAQTENPGQGFRRVTLLARNTTSNEEEMTNGSIELVVKYRLALEDPFQSYPVPTTWEYSYIVVPELNNTRSISRANPIKLEFDLSQNPIPIHATDLYLQVVYKGKLGQEEGAVAVGFKDISEPTPIDIHNDMDRICINGSWYVAGSPEALALGNQFNIDAYPHHLRNIYLRFSPINNPQWASSTDFNLRIPSLNAGGFFIREAFILSDYRFNIGDRVTVVNADPNDPYVTGFAPSIIPYTGIKNQTEYTVIEEPQGCALYNLSAPCGLYLRYYPLFNTYRGQEMWRGIAFGNASYPRGSVCP